MNGPNQNKTDINIGDNVDSIQRLIKMLKSENITAFRGTFGKISLDIRLERATLSSNNPTKISKETPKVYNPLDDEDEPLFYWDMPEAEMSGKKVSK